MTALRVLIVDDEPLARARLRTLLADCRAPAALLMGEAASAVQAMEMLQHQPVDAVLLDIHMPGATGLDLARALRQAGAPAPAIVFVTAHTEHALTAFELDAVDYLTKPVRLERLQQALQKAELRKAPALGPEADLTEFLVVHEAGRTERVPIAEVLYLKAELKYVTARTAQRCYILDDSLATLEQRFGAHFLRVHRNALAARHALRALERRYDPDEGDIWALRLRGCDEHLSVSRRQLAAVREALGVA